MTAKDTSKRKAKTDAPTKTASPRSKTVVSAWVDLETKEQLDTLAHKMRTTPSGILTQAIQGILKVNPITKRDIEAFREDQSRTVKMSGLKVERKDS